MYPSYLNLSKKEFNFRIEKLFEILKRCEICPRKCGVNRLKGEKGFCQLGSLPMISAYHSHFGEESVLVGQRGSGTVFLCSCNLACVYCQNYEISQLRIGEEISFERLAEMMIELQNHGCHNINLVSPTSHAPSIVKGLSIAIGMGLKVPLVYNTNAYDSVETLKLLDGIVDIYMPDAKYSDDKIALKYSNAPIFYSHGPIRIPRGRAEQDRGLGYSHAMKKSIKEMHRQVGDLVISNLKTQISKLQFKTKNLKNIPQGIAIKGLLVRHLVLPNNLAGTEKIVEFIAKEISPNTFINIMDQYWPYWKAGEFPELSRRITDEEYQEAIKLAKNVGLKRLYRE